MADDFDGRVYALLEEYEYGGPACVDAFKAKGDEARIRSDLSEEADDDAFIYFLIELMAEFGVTGDPDRRRGYWGVFFWPKPIYRLRDLTLGELKAITADGVWPKTAWDVRRVSVSDWLDCIGYTCAFIVGAPILITYIPLWLLSKFLPVSPVRSAIGHMMPIMGAVFLAVGVFKMFLNLIGEGWQRLRPQVFERLSG